MAAAAGVLLLCQLSVYVLPLMLGTIVGRGSETYVLTYLTVLSSVQWGASCALARAENPYARVRSDWRLAWSIRIGTALPMVAASLAVVIVEQGSSHAPWLFVTPVVLFAPCLALHFAMLRRLAGRASHGRLKEYSAIVGIGYPVALVLAIVLMLEVNELPKRTQTLYMALAFTSLLLFWLWAMLTLVYFFIALVRIAREARRAWMAADQGVRS